MHSKRSKLVWLAAAALSAASVCASVGVQAATKGPIRVGFLTVHSGALAAGGRQMGEGLHICLDQRHDMMAGRKIKLFAADTGGRPAVTKSKTRELVEKDHVQVIIGPLASFEALAINDYIKRKQIPTISPSAAADDLTQRKLDPWFVRAVGTASQPTQVLGYYAAKVLHYKRVATITDDFAYGYEEVGGFQRAFEQNGGKVVQKIWTPLNVADYGPYISEIDPKVDAVFIGFAGSNPVRFLKQYAAYGMKGKIPVIAGMIATDAGILKDMGNDAVGVISAGWYVTTLNNPANHQFVKEMNEKYHENPGYYSVGAYGACLMLDHALKTVHGNIENKTKFMAALRHVNVTNDPRGDIRLDSYGNPDMNMYIRKVERKNGKLVNVVLATYPNVSQFWTYNPKWFLKQPVYSRDYPSCKYCKK